MKESSLLFFSAFMTGCGYGLLYPALNAHAIRGEPRNVRGKITGTYTASIDAGGGIGSVILGYAANLRGSMRYSLQRAQQCFAPYLSFVV